MANFKFLYPLQHSLIILTATLCCDWTNVKGQIKPKADFCAADSLAIDSFKKGTTEFVWVFLQWQSGNTRNFKFQVFLEYKAKNKNKFVCSVFGRIYGAPICLWFYLIFSKKTNFKTQCMTVHWKKQNGFGYSQMRFCIKFGLHY